MTSRMMPATPNVTAAERYCSAHAGWSFELAKGGIVAILIIAFTESPLPVVLSEELVENQQSMWGVDDVEALTITFD